jgi:hypothetical protein
MVADPRYHKKTKAIKDVRPAKVPAANENTFKFYGAHLARVNELLGHYQNININSYAAGGLGNPMMMRFKFGSALLMIISYNIRHVKQAQKVREDSGFPG